MDILSIYDNMDELPGDGNSNYLERDIDNVMNCPNRRQDIESISNRGSSSQDNEIKDIDNKKGPVRPDGLAD